MYASHWQAKIFALAIALLFAVASLMFCLIGSAHTGKKIIVSDNAGKQNSAQVAQSAQSCTVLVKALGGCE